MDNTTDSSLITSETIESGLVTRDMYPAPKSFMERYFGPMKEGSLRGSIFTLLASAMGTGVFNLPSRAENLGVIAFITFVFLGGLFSMIGMLLMVRLIKQNKFTSYS